MSKYLSAAELLSQARQCYSTLSTYRDSGEQIQSIGIKPPSKSYANRATFQTVFSSPSSFRFDYQSNSGHSSFEFAVCQAQFQDQPQAWTTLPVPLDEPRSLTELLRGFAGISQGTSCLIARLLGLYHAGVSDSFDPDQFQLGECQIVNGFLCRALDRRSGSEAIERYWVDTQAHILRRLECRRQTNPESDQEHAELLRRQLASLFVDHPYYKTLHATLASYESSSRKSHIYETTTNLFPQLNCAVDRGNFAFVPGTV
jgi:hypothetical protein